MKKEEPKLAQEISKMEQEPLQEEEYEARQCLVC